MKTNTNSTDTIIAVDHYSFADLPSGTHKQVTISGKNAAGAQTDPSSVIYTANGTASTVAQLEYRNQSGIFPLSCIRAWATFDGTGALGAIVPIQSVNVASVVKTSTGNYQVTPTANSVTGTSLAVFVSSSLSVSTTAGTFQSYTISAGPIINVFTTLSGSTAQGVDCNLVSVMILQI
jgi:hypothetical protein